MASEDFHYKKIPALAEYIDRVGAEQLNFRRFIIKEHKGKYYVEKTLITLQADGTIECTREEHAPTETEAAGIRLALGNVEFPKSIGATEAQFKALRKKLGDDVVMPFYSRTSGLITMAQQRRQNPDGSKNYIPWTMFSDGKWRAMEPEGALPFYKPKAEVSTRIMIHEGAKAAQAAGSVEDSHPWAEELRQYEHWGIIGGALAPHRADYAELERIKPIEVVYSCDNDNAGISALQIVSECWGRSLKGIRYGDDFPLAWDMADPLPAKLFSKKKIWQGRKLANYMQPATWATKMVPVPDSKRKEAKLNADFGNEWMHTVAPEFFLNVNWPHKMWTQSEFDSIVRPYSHVKLTSDLVRKNGSSKVSALRYMPNKPSGVFSTEDDGAVINTFRPTSIEPIEGDPTPWIDYIEGLVPEPEDRRQVLRWVATLVARPDIRMRYSLLLVSEAQGIGKTTLAEAILRPLVGPWNTSNPDGKSIAKSDFNGWASKKRLVIVNEIYAGHDARVYDQLKTVITEESLRINEKFTKEYVDDNWAHIIASSNSMRALKIDDDDRRWLIPGLGDKRPESFWNEFHEWLEGDGLNIIKWWCDEFLKTQKPVGKGEHSPTSAMKRAMVVEGYSHGQLMIQEVLEKVKMKLGDEPWVLLDTQLVEYVKENLYGGRHNAHLERPITARKVAERMGLFIGDKNSGCLAWNIVANKSRVISNDSKIAKLTPKHLAENGVRLASLSDFSTL